MSATSSTVDTPVAEQNAKPAPQWLTHSVLYQLYPRSFTPDGTLAAATEKLPQLAEMGIDIVYLTPICVHDDDPDPTFWSPRQIAYNNANPKNPYRTKDFFGIDPEYGTEDDAIALVKRAHELGMKVMFDIVYHACGPTAVFLEAHPDFIQRDEQGEPKTTPWNFYPLNYENPQLRAYMLQNLRYLVEMFDVDAFRCDTCSRVPLDWWIEARELLDSLKPDIVLLAESNMPEQQLKAFDVHYSFLLMEEIIGVMDRGQTADSIREVWEKTNGIYPRGARFARYIDNHDIAHDCGVTGEKHGTLHTEGRLDEAWGSAAVDAWLALCFTLDGVPMLYNGQEVADTAHHSIYDYIPVQWENLETESGRARWQFCQQLCAMRHAEPALGDAPMQWVDNDQPQAVLSFQRPGESQTLCVLINLSDKPVELASPFVGDALSETVLARGVDPRGAQVKLAPWAFGVFKS